MSSDLSDQSGLTNQSVWESLLEQWLVVKQNSSDSEHSDEEANAPEPPVKPTQKIAKIIAEPQK